MLDLKRGTVLLSRHQSDWKEKANEIISELQRILGDSAIDIQHVGSTAINAIVAKPIIDIAVAVESFELIKQKQSELEKRGYIFRFESAHQLLFVCSDFKKDMRMCHIHVCLNESDEWKNYLFFRDYLNANKNVRDRYEKLKVSLSKRYFNNREKYTEEKHAFITSVLKSEEQFKDKLLSMSAEQKLKYNCLPEDFKESIDAGATTIDDYRMTDDGFRICTKSLSTIIEGSENEKEIYANVYVYCVVVGDNSVYSLCQMGFDDGEGGSKLNVSFIPVAKRYVNSILAKKDKSIMEGETRVNDGSNLRSQFGRALQGVNSDKSIPDAAKQLTNYFSNVKSKGALLLSDIYIEKLLNCYSEDKEGIPVYQNIVLMNKRQKARLDELGVYDEVAGKIRIKDRNNLTREEYDGLLVTHTANTSAYSFAAEVKYHADNCYNWFDLGKREAVISNSGVGGVSGGNFGSRIKGYTAFETEAGKNTQKFKYHNDSEFAKTHGWTIDREDFEYE